MTFRFMPVSVCIRGDIGIFDRVAIDEINEIIRSTLAARGEPPDRYELSVLAPEQFVVAEGEPVDVINWPGDEEPAPPPPTKPKRKARARRKR